MEFVKDPFKNIFQNELTTELQLKRQVEIHLVSGIGNMNQILHCIPDLQDIILLNT